MPFETRDLVPSAFDPPERVDCGSFVLRPLRIADAERDYETVMANRERLRGVFGPAHEWPPADLTLEQNRIDVAWHQKEFQRRDAFTYAVLDPDDTVAFGCVYIQPTSVSAYDAAVYFWISDSALEEGVDDDIERRVRRWVRDRWPFESVAYPGRDIPWPEWEPADTTPS